MNSSIHASANRSIHESMDVHASMYPWIYPLILPWRHPWKHTWIYPRIFNRFINGDISIDMSMDVSMYAQPPRTHTQTHTDTHTHTHTRTHTHTHTHTDATPAQVSPADHRCAFYSALEEMKGNQMNDLSIHEEVNILQTIAWGERGERQIWVQISNYPKSLLFLIQTNKKGEERRGRRAQKGERRI